MKTTLMSAVAHAALVAGLLIVPSSYSQYNQATTGAYGPGVNLVDNSAAAAPNDVLTFSNAVATAHTGNFGGVFNFPSNPSGTIFRGTYGVANAKRLTITSSSTMQAVGLPPSGTFTPISTSAATTTSTDQSAYNLAIGPITDALTDAPLLSEEVSQIGLTILSRTHASQYPADIRVMAGFSDGTSQALTANIGNVRGTDDTFYGFTAPTGEAITNLLLEAFEPGTENPRATRIAWDDLGFITTATGVLPPPQITGVYPANGSVHWASNGIHFEARSEAAIEPAGISLVLNSNDVSGLLVITGDPTNRFVSFNGLAANLKYKLEITVSNVAGVVSVTNLFYTPAAPETPVTIFNSGGFTDDVLYPLGLLTAVTNDDSRWVPSVETSEITDLGDGVYGKVMRRMQLGNDQTDYLLFPLVSSGVLEIELDARVSTIAERTLDLSLNSVTANGGGTQGPFIMWGTNALNYFNGTVWVAQTNLDADWHHIKMVCYVSGSRAGKFDLHVDNTLVGGQLVWRNTFSPVGTLRIGAIRGAVVQYGEVDNLVLRVAPEPLAPQVTTLLNPQHGGTTFSFSFQSQAGINHVAQYKNDIAATIWTDLETIAGDGLAKTVTHTNPPAGPLFYRIDSRLP